MQSVRGLTPMEAGAMVLPFAAAQLVFSPRSAGMVRRFGAKAVCTTGLLMVSGALASYQFLGAGGPTWVLGAIFFVQGVGMAHVMPPATESVMSALPREKAGAGSAINNVARQVAVAMGVAVLGSIVASVYRRDLAGELAALPAGARETAAESIEGAHGVADGLGASGATLVDAADAAFVHAVHVAPRSPRSSRSSPPWSCSGGCRAAPPRPRPGPPPKGPPPRDRDQDRGRDRRAGAAAGEGARRHRARRGRAG